MGNKNQIDAMAADINSLIRSDAISRALASLLCDKGYCKASDVAREIFAEIEEIRLRHIKKFDFFRNGSVEEMERKFFEGAEWGLRQLTYSIAELKKKYTEEGK